MLDPSTQSHITTLRTYLTRVVGGDFTQDLARPTTEDEFTPLYTGIQLLVEVIRQEFENLEKTNYALQERVEEKLALLNSIGDGVVVLDQDQHVTFINHSATQLLGWSEMEALHHNWIELVPLQKVDGTIVGANERPLIISAGLNDQEIAQHTYYYVKKNGDRFPISATTTPVKMNNTQVGTIIVFRDITKEKVVAQLKEDFLSIATHQLRSPLTTILWTLDMILQNPNQDPEKVKSKLETLKRNAQNMGELITDILTVTRLSSDSLQEEKKPCRVPDIARTVIDQLQTEATTRQIKITLQINDQSLENREYLADIKLLTQCMGNVVNNAVRYSREGGQVELILDTEGDSVSIMVKDQGIGIPEEDKPHIFDKFFRGKNVPEGNLPGSGLGLFIVKSIVTHWGGTLSVESQENQGTTVTLSIPLTLAS